MISTAVGLRRAAPMPKQANIHPMGTSPQSLSENNVSAREQMLVCIAHVLDDATHFWNHPFCSAVHVILTILWLPLTETIPHNHYKILLTHVVAWAGVDDIDADMEYELLETKYKEGVTPVKRVVKKLENDEKHLKCIPARGVLFGITHVEELDQICFLE